MIKIHIESDYNEKTLENKIENFINYGSTKIVQSINFSTEINKVIVINYSAIVVYEEK